jgi:hypothetical protein
MQGKEKEEREIKKKKQRKNNKKSPEMYTQHNKSGAFALFFPLDFQYMNVLLQVAQIVMGGCLFHRNMTLIFANSTSGLSGINDLCIPGVFGWVMMSSWAIPHSGCMDGIPGACLARDFSSNFKVTSANRKVCMPSCKVPLIVVRF